MKTDGANKVLVVHENSRCHSIIDFNYIAQDFHFGKGGGGGGCPHEKGEFMSFLLNMILSHEVALVINTVYTKTRVLPENRK